MRKNKFTQECEKQPEFQTVVRKFHTKIAQTDSAGTDLWEMCLRMHS